jgi:hypothetical protein
MEDQMLSETEILEAQALGLLMARAGALGDSARLREEFAARDREFPWATESYRLGQCLQYLAEIAASAREMHAALDAYNAACRANGAALLAACVSAK